MIGDELVLAVHPLPPSSGASLAEAENEVPLSPLQARDLGRAIALAGQVEMLVVELISSLSGTPAGEIYEDFERRTLGPKIQAMLAALPPNDNDDTGLVAELEHLLSTRNHLAHGLWAYVLDASTQRGLPGCVHRSKVIYPTELAEICVRFGRLSRLLGAKLVSVNPRFPARKNAPIRFFVATENVDIASLGLKRASA
jgi:hypothetical protein